MDRTVSLCIPADAICKHNKNIDQLTHAAYEIARSACMFKISEIIVQSKDKTSKEVLILGSLLQFFVTPRYLVKETFAKALSSGTIPKNVFNKAKTLPLIPTIMEYLQPGVNKECNFREGISINKNVMKHRRKTANGKVAKLNKSVKTTKFVQVGADKVLEIQNENGLPLNVRVSIDMKEKKVVGFKEAWGNAYCGYSVRLCSSVIEIFTEVNTEVVGEDGYDMSVLVKTGDFFGKDKNASLQLKEVTSADAREKEHVVVVVVGNESVDKGEEEQLDVFDGCVRVPAGARAEEGAIVALSVVCQW